MSDEFDEQSIKILPCMISCGEILGHDPRCPYRHRPAVAAALREIAADRDKWKKECGSVTAALTVSGIKAMREELADLCAEVEQLKAQLTEGQLYDCPRCGSRMRLAMEKKP